MYTDTLITNLYNISNKIEGSWILMYYSSLLLSLGINSNYNIWTFRNNNLQYGYSCFVRLTNINNSWIR